jgi:hypothetical protein
MEPIFSENKKLETTVKYCLQNASYLNVFFSPNCHVQRLQPVQISMGLQ